MFKMFRNVPSVDSRNNRKKELYIEMREALRNYTKALEDYENIVKEMGANSTIASIFYAQLNHHRTDYYNLRLKYERKFGNAKNYVLSVSRLHDWSDKTGANLLMKPINNTEEYALQS